MSNSIRNYYHLTKPGIVRGNMVHLLAGALLAQSYGIKWPELIGVLIGTSLVIASACVLNNYIDRGIDAKMKRTKKRALVTGMISVKRAMLFAAILALLGFGLLILLTNLIVFLIGLIAYIFYVIIYAVAKRKTVHSTLIGAIPGALPAMAGYVAISGQIDTGAWLVFLLVLVWQMPHFYAISIFRRDEYKAAGIPVLGVVAPFVVVKHYVLAYMVLYVFVIGLLIQANILGATASVMMLAGAAYWVYVFYTASPEPIQWARTVFGVSLLLTLILLAASLVNVFLPPLGTVQ